MKLSWLLPAVAPAAAVQVKSLEPGATQDLSGMWEYRPGFQPQYVCVPVPQMLSRISVAGRFRRLQSLDWRVFPPHSYIPAEEKPDVQYSVVFEIPVGKGKILVCDLDLGESMVIDPAARLFARNLVAAAR